MDKLTMSAVFVTIAFIAAVVVLVIGMKNKSKAKKGKKSHHSSR
jgi:hypothetical protein